VHRIGPRAPNSAGHVQVYTIALRRDPHLSIDNTPGQQIKRVSKTLNTATGAMVLISTKFGDLRTLGSAIEGLPLARRSFKLRHPARSSRRVT